MKSPSKNKVAELCQGRHIYNLGKIALHDVKILSAWAVSWLQNDLFPSRNTWEDLYSFLNQGWKAKKPTEKGCVGWISFVIFAKYNPEKKTKMSLLNDK